MKCQYCNNEVQPGATSCPACGAAAPAAAPSAYANQQAPAPGGYMPQAQPQVVVVNNGPQAPYMQAPFMGYPYPPKSRLTYILLGLFLGGLGIHNFYAKRTGCGILQLLLTLTFFGAFISGLWVLIELFTVDKDGNHVPFK